MMFKRKERWECLNCPSKEDVWDIPIGWRMGRTKSLRLCLPCRREIIRRLLDVSIGDPRVNYV